MRCHNLANYNTQPEIKIEKVIGGTFSDYSSIIAELSKIIFDKKQDKTILAIECYPGVNLTEIKTNIIQPLQPTLILNDEDFTISSDKIEDKLRDVLTDDRVFGVMSHYEIADFIDNEKIAIVKKKIAQTNGLIIIYGIGMQLLGQADILVYADMTRWELQLRYRNGLSNWHADNATEDILQEVKRGYFFEWRMADRQKKRLHQSIDYLLDTTQKEKPKMVDGPSYRHGLKQVTHTPFRLVPYFDSSVWGGNWMKEHFHLDPKAINYGWAFDGVPEENSIVLNFQGVKLEIPAINVVFFHPNALLGQKVHARFGTEFPIRFDYLDTMGGGNLSLQVHPLVEYIQENFGMSYTQDESYYILDASQKSTVFLGVKDNINPTDILNDLEKAQKDSDYEFPAEKYINQFSVKKHDHISIPAGTLHCSGVDTVVLEISATPYIFTFKCWDWGRKGLDGLPRPVHLEHAANNIQFDRQTDFAKKLVNVYQKETLNISKQKGVKTEKTGLNDLEFIETRRHWFSNKVILQTHSSVNMLNLVEGESAFVESLDDSFTPFLVNYGETFIVPENIETYLIRNASCDGNEIAVIQAYVRV